jgi:hypothetical protein
MNRAKPVARPIQIRQTRTSFSNLRFVSFIFEPFREQVRPPTVVHLDRHKIRRDFLVEIKNPDLFLIEIRSL